MDEWANEADVSVWISDPMSFAKADMDLCLNRIHRRLRPPDSHLHFPTGDLADTAAVTVD